MTTPVTIEGYTVDELLALPDADFHTFGGGEGVLPAIGSLAERYARNHGLEAIEWLVHALTCAHPNLDLRRILERRGFERHDLNGTPVLRLVRRILSEAALARHGAALTRIQ